MYPTRVNNIAIESVQHYAFLLAAGLTISLAAAYMYFLSVSVIHVVISRENEEKMHRVSAEIATLEATYMEKKIEIASEVVGQSGYVTAIKKVFVNRDQSSVVTKR
ncbi:hypothetical protein A2392_00995 [Candidatus Kaiserbacteria bacterium RIFOXYB1_FULL_46_14]|uniref:Uncharacterized protein n=1 Tax=Candidatus Kaiserbacteria bacterium RIFOXYB1_FULL_46_14 TaxID=1798531 RepID=A0A1F6FJI9_9BACT|nr:MAG: hypothetical protein A2392_00995 [Candidatus Kaiserbacteria bacterium RIFOXYB1_FULL_46_14]